MSKTGNWLKITLLIVATPAVMIAAGLACAKAAPTTPITNSDINYSVDGKEAYARVLRSIVDADLSVEVKDVDAGIVQTEWSLSGKETIGIGSEVQRRVRFKISLENGSCHIRPQSEKRVKLLADDPWGAWEDGAGFTAFEQKVTQTLVQYIQTNLQKPVAGAPAAVAPIAAPAATPSVAPATK